MQATVARLRAAGFRVWSSPDETIVLCHGDALQVLPLLEPGSVDLLLTDPQYGISQPGVAHEGPPGKGKRSFDFFSDDTPEQAMQLTLSAWAGTRPLLTQSASAYWWVGHYAFGPLVSAYHGDGWKTRFLVWSKACPAPAPPGSGWPSAAELCVYAFRPGRIWTHNGKDAPRSNVIVADSYRHGIPGKCGHPTQKPFAVMLPLIRASSKRGATVLDPFMGSGTVPVACLRTGRRCLAIEIEPQTPDSPDYFGIAVRRVQAELNRHPLFEPPPKRQKELIP